MATKLMTITIKVEPPALGPVLLKLKEMPGVAEFNLEMNDSKAPPADDPQTPKAARPNLEEVIMALLIKGGPVSIEDARRAVALAGYEGHTKQVYQPMYQLKKRGIAKSVGKGVIELTAKARKSISGHEDSAIRLLPKPRAEAKEKTVTKAPAKPKTNGAHPHKEKRQPPGHGQKLLLQLLVNGPVKRPEIRAALESGGMSAKSVEGVGARAREAGLVKLSDGVFELTAKGKQEVETVNG
jgi:hypothetical protein